jgi:hypothetical protein
MTHVYIVHGFGCIMAFSTLRKARIWRNKYARSCQISKVELDDI